MATQVMLKNSTTKMLKKGYVGYSWTYLFFGCLVPFIRGEIGIASLHLLFTLITGGIWQIVVSFLYNKQYMKRMLEKGWVFSDDENKIQYAKLQLGIASE